jgi:hypothetical protein
MGRNIKKNKTIDFFISFIAHDFGAYNSVWKWDDLPEPLNHSYELLEIKLKEWEEKGYIKIFIQNGTRMIEIKSIPEN